MAAKVNGFSLAYTAIGGVVLWIGHQGHHAQLDVPGPAPGAGPHGEPGADRGHGGGQRGVEHGIAGCRGDRAGAGRGDVDPELQPGPDGRLDLRVGTGAQWAALTNVIERESGGNPAAMNASGAYGIAQALGHAGPGDAGSVSRTAYGGYGVPTSTNIGANSGNATDQLIWMMAYIKSAYGSPEGAWASEQSRGFY